MSRSTDPGHFFQTDAAESIRARRAAKSGNKNGDPIVLSSKILNVTADPFSSSSIYTAEGAGCVRRVNIETKATESTYKGPNAPLTSVAIGGPRGAFVFAGCWDKDIWSWERESSRPGRRYKGHSDFVKAVICVRIGGQDCLISGGADRKIMVWNTTSGERLHTLRDTTDSMMAVQDLAVDPEDSTETEIVVVSASSDPHIRRWRISLSSASQIVDIAPESTGKPARQTIQEHETSVYQVLFWGDDEETDLWTASADGTAKCLSRAQSWSTEETYEHGDYVRTITITGDWVVTAGRDEDVKVWDRSTGKLRHVYEGHYEEVTGLVALPGERAVSVSIDGTVRTWELSSAALEKAIKEKAEGGKSTSKDKTEVKEGLLTAEEEAELAELMGSDGE